MKEAKEILEEIKIYLYSKDSKRFVKRYDAIDYANSCIDKVDELTQKEKMWEDVNKQLMDRVDELEKENETLKHEITRINDGSLLQEQITKKIELELENAQLRKQIENLPGYDELRDIIVGGSSYSVQEVERVAKAILDRIHKDKEE